MLCFGNTFPERTSADLADLANPYHSVQGWRCGHSFLFSGSIQHSTSFQEPIHAQSASHNGNTTTTTTTTTQPQIQSSQFISKQGRSPPNTHFSFFTQVVVVGQPNALLYVVTRLRPQPHTLRNHTPYKNVAERSEADCVFFFVPNMDRKEYTKGTRPPTPPPPPPTLHTRHTHAHTGL